MAQHPALTEGRVAVITGAASGIGLAAPKRFAATGLRICHPKHRGPSETEPVPLGDPQGTKALARCRQFQDFNGDFVIR